MGKALPGDGGIPSHHGWKECSLLPSFPETVRKGQENNLLLRKLHFKLLATFQGNHNYWDKTNFSKSYRKQVSRECAFSGT